MPKPPAYASPPPLWGDEAHVRELFAPHGLDVEVERATNPFVGFASAEEWVEFMESNYGPLVTAREKLRLEGRWDELREELVALTASFDAGRPGGLHVESEYLLDARQARERHATVDSSRVLARRCRRRERGSGSAARSSSRSTVATWRRGCPPARPRRCSATCSRRASGRPIATS